MKQSKSKMDRDELINKFNKLADKHKAVGSNLSDLTDKELFIFTAGKTLDYGRSVEDSLENAMYQMKDRKKAERMFGTKGPEDLLNMDKSAATMAIGTLRQWGQQKFVKTPKGSGNFIKKCVKSMVEAG